MSPDTFATDDGGGMANYLKPEEDGLPMRASGAWAMEKLDYLRRYMDIFVTSMRDKPWRAMHYVDLFAGPGKCRTKDKSARVFLGSPLIALNVAHPFSGYFFVDLDAGTIAVLQKRCAASPLAGRVNCLIGDSNRCVMDIVSRIQTIDRTFIQGKWPSLNLAFLDPEGLELHWETVAALAGVNRMDLIIHYPQMALERTMPKAFQTEGASSVDLFFGDPDWRKIYAEWKDRQTGLHRQLIDYYKQRLQNLGYAEVLRDDETGDEPLMRNAQKKAPLYRLLFASKHPLGNKFWHQVTQRDLHGQRRLL